MSHSPKTCLDTSQDDRCFFIRSSNQISIDDHRPVRSMSHLSTGRIGIFLPVLFRHCIMINHRIHIAGRYQKAQTRFTKHLDPFRIFPVRLSYHSHRIAPAFQETADDRRPERRMIHIRISTYIDKIRLFYSSLPALFHCHRQKLSAHGCILSLGISS